MYKTPTAPCFVRDTITGEVVTLVGYRSYPDQEYASLGTFPPRSIKIEEFKKNFEFVCKVRWSAGAGVYMREGD